MRAAPAGLVALVCATALAGCFDGATSTTAASNRELTKGVPAQIDQHPDGFVSRDVMHPLMNAWRAGSTTRFTQVDAGALTRDRSIGALAVFRYDLVSVVQDLNLVQVIGAGPIRITSAPTGMSAAAPAQEHGRIEFEGRNGVHGTLHLRDDGVALRP